LSDADAYTVDAIALLCYLADRLPRRVDEIFKRAEDEKALLVVPSIVVGESIFALLRGKEIFGTRIPIERLATFLDVLETSRTVRLVDLTVKGWRLVMTIDLPELHDRMIVATYLVSNSRAILTDDKQIRSLSKVKAIWN
jgi:predicted nucleic acid-binding protein